MSVNELGLQRASSLYNLAGDAVSRENEREETKTKVLQSANIALGFENPVLHVFTATPPLFFGA